jgi:hypothetical protein
VKAEPGHVVVQIDALKRQVLQLDAREQLGGSRIARDEGRKRRIEAPENRHVLAKRDEFRRQGGHHFFAEPRLQIVRAPHQMAQPVAHAWAVAQHDRDQLQARWPAACQVVDHAGVVGADSAGAQVAFEKAARFGRREEQPGAVEFN